MLMWQSSRNARQPIDRERITYTDRQCGEDGKIPAGHRCNEDRGCAPYSISFTSPCFACSGVIWLTSANASLAIAVETSFHSRQDLHRLMCRGEDDTGPVKCLTSISIETAFSSWTCLNPTTILWLTLSFAPRSRSTSSSTRELFIKCSNRSVYGALKLGPLRYEQVRKCYIRTA